MTPERRAAEVTRSKDGWLEGYPLLWCDEPFTFVRFDPAWPRAICKRPDDSECAIDIRTATPISTGSHRKRAERQRRREAGEVRVEVWLDAQTLAQVDKYARIVGCNRQEMIIKALKVWKMTNPTLERAARALFDSEAQDDWDGSQLTWDEAPKEYRQHARRQARAVLIAVRDIDPVIHDKVTIGGWLDDEMKFSEAWHGGIDAILNDGDGE